MERTQTIRDFMMQCECFEYSQEHYDLMKEAMEADLMDQFIQNQLFISENANSINTADGYMFTEGCFMESTSEDNLIAIYEKKEAKEQNIFQKIWAGIKNIFSKIGNFFKRLFTGNSEAKEKYEKLKGKNEHLEDEIKKLEEKVNKFKDKSKKAGDLVADEKKKIEKLEKENKKSKDEINKAKDEINKQKSQIKKINKQNKEEVKEAYKQGKKDAVNNFVKNLMEEHINDPRFDLYGKYMADLAIKVLYPAYNASGLKGSQNNIVYEPSTISVNNGLAPNASIGEQRRYLYNLAFSDKVTFKITDGNGGPIQNETLFSYSAIIKIMKLWKNLEKSCSSVIKPVNESVEEVFTEKKKNKGGQSRKQQSNEDKAAANAQAAQAQTQPAAPQPQQPTPNNQQIPQQQNHSNDKVMKVYKNNIGNIDKIVMKHSGENLAKNGIIILSTLWHDANEFTQLMNNLTQIQNESNNTINNSNSILLYKNYRGIQKKFVDIYTAINKSAALLIKLYAAVNKYQNDVLSSLSVIDSDIAKIMNYDAENIQKKKDIKANTKQGGYEAPASDEPEAQPQNPQPQANQSSSQPANNTSSQFDDAKDIKDLLAVLNK